MHCSRLNEIDDIKHCRCVAMLLIRDIWTHRINGFGIVNKDTVRRQHKKIYKKGWKILRIWSSFIAHVCVIGFLIYTVSCPACTIQDKLFGESITTTNVISFFVCGLVLFVLSLWGSVMAHRTLNTFFTDKDVDATCLVLDTLFYAHCKDKVNGEEYKEMLTDDFVDHVFQNVSSNADYSDWKRFSYALLKELLLILIGLILLSPTGEGCRSLVLLVLYFTQRVGVPLLYGEHSEIVTSLWKLVQMHHQKLKEIYRERSIVDQASETLGPYLSDIDISVLNFTHANDTV